ncbi:pantothenate kinase [Alkalispirochaeta americana]|uniref:Type III pantothenate kinase n=1 Tax=Alkalispirochaeta americana TaxID=159291 RepID=A0A1N6VP62_9SPIO|nr:type III pantothenate kinase [Alkalispirochaeta americana]SIQ79620.1 pantothenate kinase [Alkalispirochaeta americana]
MVLTVDVGNSNIAFGIHTGTTWLDHWRLRTDPEKTADEYHVLFHNLLATAGHELASIDRIVVSSVVPALTPAIITVSEKLCPLPPLIVEKNLNTGLDRSAPIPAELGNDLLANAVAAFHQFRSAAIVVDFGTALTFTAISSRGAILGVSIAPGIRSAMRALSANTAQLPMVELKPPPSALPRTTMHAIQAGIVYGYTGLVKEVLQRMSDEMGTDKPVLVATGGFAEELAPVAGLFHRIDQWLTLEGLRILAELNPHSGA